MAFKLKKWLGQAKGKLAQKKQEMPWTTDVSTPEIVSQVQQEPPKLPQVIAAPVGVPTLDTNNHQPQQPSYVASPGTHRQAKRRQPQQQPTQTPQPTQVPAAVATPKAKLQNDHEQLDVVIPETESQVQQRQAQPPPNRVLYPAPVPAVVANPKINAQAQQQLLQAPHPTSSSATGVAAPEANNQPREQLDVAAPETDGRARQQPQVSNLNQALTVVATLKADGQVEPLPSQVPKPTLVLTAVATAAAYTQSQQQQPPVSASNTESEAQQQPAQAPQLTLTLNATGVATTRMNSEPQEWPEIASPETESQAQQQPVTVPQPALVPADVATLDANIQPQQQPHVVENSALRSVPYAVSSASTETSRTTVSTPVGDNVSELSPLRNNEPGLHLQGPSQPQNGPWHVNAPEPPHLRGPSIILLAFLADGDHILSASNDNSIRIWDAWTGENLLTHKLDFPGLPILGDLHRDTSLVALAWQNRLRIWRLSMEAGRPSLSLLKTHHFFEDIKSLAFCPSGRNIACITKSYIRIWGSLTGNLHHNIALEADHVVYPAASKIIYSTPNGDITIRDLDGKERDKTLRNPDRIAQLSVSAGGTYGADADIGSNSTQPKRPLVIHNFT
ncbi:hypothetical protein GQ53DRAFT_818527 [Thozetella sp. PMI_491]|nr:hypothetical protein GQ53DRAFT_818527 [Thozetella sp. PMI_491]